MKFRQKHVLMALITITLIASGCASGSNGGGDSDTDSTGTNPVQATEFVAAPNPSPTGNTVTFTLELTNSGNIDAVNVVGKLWNPPFAESDQDTRTWRDGNEDGVSVPDRSFAFGTLNGQEEGVETFAEPKTLRLTAPVLDEGQSFPYNFRGEYSYKYSTNGETTITVMDSDQYRDSGTEKRRSVDISHNSAPISLEGQLLSGNPIVYYEGDTPPKTPEFCVVVSNEGGGTVFSDPEGAFQEGSGNQPGEYVIGDRENKVDLTIESLGTTGVKDPEKQNSGYSTSASNTVELISGEEVRKCFQLKVGSLANAGSQKEIGPINVKADYGYSENTGTQVTVESR